MTAVFDKRKRLLLVCLVAAVAVCGGLLVSMRVVYPRVLPQQAIGLLPELADPARGQRVLVFSPHPDDETIAAGGYIAQATKEGAEVRIVLVTDGNRHHTETVRYGEFRKATAILGVTGDNLIFMGLPDGRLRQEDPTMLSERLATEIDNFKPDIVFYPHPRDFHPDHAIVGRLVAEILGKSARGVQGYQYLVHYEFYYPQPKRLAPHLYQLPPLRLSRSRWHRFMLSTSVEETKSHAIAMYRSQESDMVLKELMLANVRRNELFAAP